MKKTYVLKPAMTLATLTPTKVGHKPAAPTDPALAALVNRIAPAPKAKPLPLALPTALPPRTLPPRQPLPTATLNSRSAVGRAQLRSLPRTPPSASSCSTGQGRQARADARVAGLRLCWGGGGPFSFSGRAFFGFRRQGWGRAGALHGEGRRLSHRGARSTQSL